MAKHSKKLSKDQAAETIEVLQKRFEKNTKRHPSIKWPDVQAKLEANPQKLWSLYQMESTGGEPDVTGFDSKTHEYIFTDCSAETPKGRRSICYDHEALEARKEHKPQNSAVAMAEDMGIELLSEHEYRELQKLGPFDTKTSSWIKTPESIRKLGGAIFGDFRYGQVFIYHNSAESYYGVRGFRASIRV